MIIALWMGITILGACDDDERLTPSETIIPGLDFPQGNGPHDERIITWFEKTGVYILYRFTPAEVYFTGNSTWAEIYQDTLIVSNTYSLGENLYVKDSMVYLTNMGIVQNSWKLGITYTDGLWEEVSLDEEAGKVYIRAQELNTHGNFSVLEAETEHVGEQLEWIEETFLNLYPVELLCETLPLKIILGRELQTASSAPGVIMPNEAIFSFNNLIFNRGDASITSLTTDEKDDIRLEVNAWFVLECLVPLVDLTDFYAQTDYYWAGGVASRPSQSQCYGLGLLVWPNMTGSEAYLQQEDLEAYVRVILANSYDKLTTKPNSPSFSTSDHTGILHPDKDVNNKIRTKYDMVINAFKTIGVDLQSIGNMNN